MVMTMIMMTVGYYVHIKYILSFYSTLFNMVMTMIMMTVGYYVLI